VQVDEARTHFKAGVSYLQDPEGERYEEAYAEFKKSYELSKSPKVLGNVALCAMMLERDGEAIDAYTRYLREVVDIDPEERAQNTRDLETLTAGAAHVAVALDSSVKVDAFSVYDTRIPVRGAQIANVYGPLSGTSELLIRPGRHVLSIKDGGGQSATWEVNAAPGARLSHEFRIEAPRKSEQAPVAKTASTPLGPIAMMSVGGAALIAGGIFGVVSLSKTHSLEDRCPNDVCAPNVYGDVSSARGYVRATDFLLIGGGVVAAAGVGWLLFSPSTSVPAATHRAAEPTFTATASAGPHGYVGTLRVRF
jgi:hypothetical protein